MPASIASTATSAPACTDCLPAPPSSTSASASTTAATPPQTTLLDPSTFEPPELGSSDGEAPRVIIEFCDRCRWLHRATWTQTELFLTFPPSVDASSDETPRAAPVASGLKSISLVPRNAPETGGRFRVWLLLGDSAAKEVQGPYPTANKGKEERWRGWELVWDRKIEGRFPEMKELKQRIRNLIAPSQNLGHSDKPVASTLSSTQPQIPATEPDTTPANTTAEMQRSAVPPKSAEDVDLSALAEQPLKPLTEDDFAPRYRCM
ncbi:hypothetical protein JCM8115_001913 [Rhodotorula mucilaginosa]